MAIGIPLTLYSFISGSGDLVLSMLVGVRGNLRASRMLGYLLTVALVAAGSPARLMMLLAWKRRPKGVDPALAGGWKRLV